VADVENARYFDIALEVVTECKECTRYWITPGVVGLIDNATISEHQRKLLSAVARRVAGAKDRLPHAEPFRQNLWVLYINEDNCIPIILNEGSSQARQKAEQNT